MTLNRLGLTQARIGDEAGALDSFEAAVAILTELGDSHGAGRVLANLGSLQRGQGHEEQARATWIDALERLEPGSPEHDRTAQQLRSPPSVVRRIAGGEHVARPLAPLPVRHRRLCSPRVA